MEGTTTTTVTLTVPIQYVLPEFYKRADPSDVATALDVASRLPSFLGSHSDKMDVKKSVLAAMDEYKSLDLKAEITKAEERDRKTIDKLEKLLSEKRAELVNMTILQEKTEMQKQTLEASLEEKLSAIRSEESFKAKELMHNAVQEAHERRMQIESELCKVLKDRCTATEETAKTINALQTRISELETPMGRGTVGEMDVAQCLRDMGFVVEDTSTGDAKNSGYMDLLIYPEASDSADPPKIAIEIKNRKEVKRENITSFEEHVRKGIEKKLFDSAIFVSIRAHVKRDASSALDMYEDDMKRPLVPVSWIGPERSRNAPPLTQDQLEAHVLLHCALLTQTERLRGVFEKQATESTEEDKKQVQNFVTSMIERVNDIFSDLGRQSSMLDDMKKNVTAIRVHAIQMVMNLYDMNSSVSWLGRSVTTSWWSTFENARRKVSTHTDAQIWNDCSTTKATIERTIGKDAMLKALRLDSSQKRARTE